MTREPDLLNRSDSTPPHPFSLKPSERLTAAQLREFSQREQVSASVALPAVLTIAWVHWGSVPASGALAWIAFMAIVLLIRIANSRTAPYFSKTGHQLARQCRLRVLLAAFYGFGWGAMLFLLDTGKLDFLFMFKLAALAAVLGITVNPMSVLPQVYVGFVTPLFLTATLFVFANATFLGWNQKLSLLTGGLVYLVFLLVAARRTAMMTSTGLEQGFEFAEMLSHAKEAEEKLKASQERLRLILDSASEGIYGADTAGICTFVNKSCLRILGYESEDSLVGKAIHALIHHTYPDGRPYPKEECRVRLSTKEGRTTHVDDEVHWRPDGSSFPVEYRSHPMYRNGELVGAVVSFSDITERKKAEQALRESEERLRLALNAANQGWFDLDLRTGEVTVSPEYPRMLGYTPDEFRSDVATWLEHVHPDDRDALLKVFGACVEDGGPYTMEYRRQTKSGGWTWLRSVGQIVQWDATHRAVRMIGVHTDITQAKEHERQLEHLAHHDAVTGLPNRVLLADRLHQAMAQTDRRGGLLAVAYLDLDGFKAVNDSHGHDVGDKLLSSLASRMKQVLREGDTLARLGGDEFVAVLLDLTDPAASTPMLSRLLAAAAEPVRVGELILKVSASIGVTFYPQQGDLDADQLIRQADQAMYRAKMTGKNRYHMFQPDVNPNFNTQSRAAGS
jgi:diguanylate cyclase (GGDEF)-like protein/PAS domain S-box-containing protein